MKKKTNGGFLEKRKGEWEWAMRIRFTYLPLRTICRVKTQEFQVDVEMNLCSSEPYAKYRRITSIQFSCNEVSPPPLAGLMHFH